MTIVQRALLKMKFYMLNILISISIFTQCKAFDSYTFSIKPDTIYASINDSPHFPVKCIFIDSLNNKWFGVTGSDFRILGIIKLDSIFSDIYNYNSGIEIINNSKPKRNKELLELYEITSFKIDQKGNKWIGTNDGIICLKGEQQIYYSTKNGLVDNSINDMIVDKLNNIWIATQNGVSKFDGKKWTSFNVIDGLANKRVSCLKADINNSIWFGTRGGGVSKYDGESWTTYNVDNGLVSNYVVSIGIDLNGDKWFGLLNTGSVSQFDDTTWKTHVIDEYNKSSTIAIEIDSKGNKWFATNSIGLVVKFDNKEWTKYHCKNGLHYAQISSLKIDLLDNVWIGLLVRDSYKFKVTKFDGLNWTNFEIPEKLYNKK